MAIEGMLSVFSMQVMDAVLVARKVDSHWSSCRIGVFRGRSAAILAGHTNPNERLILVDVEDQFDRAALQKIHPDTQFVVMSTASFVKTFSDFKELKQRCRFIHVDSSHYYRMTIAELGLAEQLIQKRGLIVLDDFANLNFSQILAATYKYLFTTETILKLSS